MSHKPVTDRFLGPAWAAHIRPISIAFLLMGIALLLAPTALAQTDDLIDLTWYVVSGGGTISSISDGYVLSGTVGQLDATMRCNDNYTLLGGFWSEMDNLYQIYLPLVRHDGP